MPDNQPWGLYISIPFCRFKCTYCNFASGVFAAAQLDRYLAALHSEMKLWSAGVSPAPRVDTAYLGGGTPSMLSPQQMRRLFEDVRAHFDVAPGSEITLEAAPAGITAELATAWAEAGINRVSLGVQSFIEKELKAVGRPHCAETVAADIALLRATGLRHINVDLIAGLPHQTAASWEESLRCTGQLRPEHVSVYLIEIDEDSRLGSEVIAGGKRYSASLLPSDDDAADFYCHAIERLAEFGYRQYEISNFALAGCDSRHNRKYWEGAPYLGLGVDAHSFDGAERRANTDSLDQYLAAVERGESPVVARHTIDDRRRTEERLFLGLRQNRGVELTTEERTRYGNEIDKMSATGLLEFSDGRLRLTDRGRLLSNEVFAEFIE